MVTEVVTLPLVISIMSMAFSGEDKEIRMSTSLGYNNNLQNLDHHSLVHQQDKPPHFSESHGGGIGGSTSPAINSSRSKPIKPPSSVSPSVISHSVARTIYRECLKNHAASIGGNVTDGCGEFMPSGEEGTMEALKCAACNCHRNFHRRETQHGGENNNNAIVLHHHHLQLPSSLTSLSLTHHRKSAPDWPTIPAQPVKISPFGGGGGSGSIATDSSSEELNFNAYQSVAAPQPPYGLSKKRYRTKFSQEQKEKMLEFADKLGWRIPREDDSEVQRFCGEVGVKRQVFKVWMHNNKSSSSSKKNGNDPQEALNMMSS